MFWFSKLTYKIRKLECSFFVSRIASKRAIKCKITLKRLRPYKRTWWLNGLDNQFIMHWSTFFILTFGGVKCIIYISIRSPFALFICHRLDLYVMMKNMRKQFSHYGSIEALRNSLHGNFLCYFYFSDQYRV